MKGGHPKQEKPSSGAPQSPATAPCPLLSKIRLYGTCVNEYPPSADDLAYRAWYLKDRGNRHRHNHTEVLVCVAGPTSFGWLNRVFRLETGAVLLVERLEQHAFYYPQDVGEFEHLWVSWQDAPLQENGIATFRFHGRRDSVTQDTLCFPRSEQIFADVRSAWDSFGSLEESMRPLGKERLRTLLARMILELSFRAQSSQQELDTGSTSVRKICAVIDSHPDREVPLSEAARVAGYSKYYFHRLFLRCTGETLHTYNTRRRIAHARQLLEGGWSCRAVAEEMSFASPTAFSHWYKRHQGVTPSREMNGGQKG
jgi:AraC-like DNA-binding protein